MSARTIDRIISVMIILGSLILLRELRDIPREGYIFPSILLYGMMGCSGILLIRTTAKGRGKDKIHVFKDVPVSRWLAVVAIFILYVIGIFQLGFFASTFGVSVAITTVLSEDRRIKTLLSNVIFSSGLTFFFFIFFVKLMKVRFPDALLM